MLHFHIYNVIRVHIPENLNVKLFISIILQSKRLIIIHLPEQYNITGQSLSKTRKKLTIVHAFFVFENKNFQFTYCWN